MKFRTLVASALLAFPAIVHVHAQTPAPVPSATAAPSVAPAKGEDQYDPTKPLSPTNQPTNQPKPAVTEPAVPRVTAESVMKAVSKASAQRSFLWEVKSPSNVLYLFGTIHVGKSTFYPLPPAVEEALANSAKLVVEANISSAEGTEDVPAIISYKPPDTLDKKIPAPLYERLKIQLARLKVPEAAVKPMKPFVIGGLLAISEFSRLGYEMNYGVDAYLISKAKEYNKPVLELESQRAQLMLMADMPQDLQEAFLDNALVTLENGNTADQVTGMVNAWQSGDTKLMQEVTEAVNKDMRLNDRIDEILVYGRNREMQKKIEGYLDTADIHFVAVGSLHLIGPRGLLAGLKVKGYVVTQK